MPCFSRACVSFVRWSCGTDTYSRRWTPAGVYFARLESTGDFGALSRFQEPSMLACDLVRSGTVQMAYLLRLIEVVSSHDACAIIRLLNDLVKRLRCSSGLRLVYFCLRREDIRLRRPFRWVSRHCRPTVTLRRLR